MSLGKAKRRDPAPPPPLPDDEKAIETAVRHMERIRDNARAALQKPDMEALTYLRHNTAPDAWRPWQEWMARFMPEEHARVLLTCIDGTHERVEVFMDRLPQLQPDEQKALIRTMREYLASTANVTSLVADTLRPHKLDLRLTDVDLHILKLLKKSPATRDALLVRMNGPMSRSKATLDKHLTALSDAHLIERLDGPRSPWGITPAGKQQIDYRDSH